uniref:Uncharacterized protein n=1 Tax=Biomphalaria glabrata TaxID=6526 RepID=A0A2C9M5U3_BIOGL
MALYFKVTNLHILINLFFCLIFTLSIFNIDKLWCFSRHIRNSTGLTNQDYLDVDHYDYLQPSTPNLEDGYKQQGLDDGKDTDYQEIDNYDHCRHDTAAYKEYKTIYSKVYLSKMHFGFRIFEFQTKLLWTRILFLTEVKI